MQLNEKDLMFIDDEKSLNIFLDKNNIKSEDFKILSVSDIFERFHGIKENDKFESYPIISAIKNKNEFLIKTLLNYENIFKTNMGFYPSSSRFNNVKNNVSLKTLLSENSFYLAYKEEELVSLFSVINEKILDPYVKEDLRYQSPFQSEAFIKYGLPIILKNKKENLLRYILLPLLSKFNESATSMMKNNSWDDIDFLFKTIRKNKQDLFDNVANTGKPYDKDRILKILRDGYTALLAFLNPETLYESITSATKNTQSIFVEKISNLLDLSDKLGPHAKENILYESEQNALRLDLNNPKSHKNLKNAPLSLSIDKDLQEITDCILKHGYEINNIEKKYIELKSIYIEKNSNDNNDDYEKFITIVHTKNKTSYKKLNLLLDSLDENSKNILFDKIILESKNKEQKSPKHYDLSFSEKSIREDSERYSLISYMILNNHIEMTLSMLEKGYKLSKAEYGLMVVPLSKLTVAPLDKENLPVELINYKIINLLKDYPVDYKKLFMTNVIEREFEKTKKNKQLNRSMDWYAYELINDTNMNFDEFEQSLMRMKFQYKNKFIPPLIMSFLLTNENIKEVLTEQKDMNIENFVEKFKVSVLLTMPFLKDQDVKNNYIQKIENIISKMENDFPQSKEIFEKVSDLSFKKIYLSCIAQKEKSIIIDQLSQDTEYNNNKRRL